VNAARRSARHAASALGVLGDAGSSAARSPLDAVAVPRVLALHAVHLRDKPAVIEDGGAVTTFGGLHAGASAVAAALRAYGVEPGQPVGIALRSSADYLAIALGVMLAGAVAVPLNTRLVAAEMHEYLTRVRPVLVLADGTAPVPPVSGVAVLQLDAAEPVASLVSAVASDGSADGMVRGAGRFEPSSTDPAVAFPTGGTTGLPKAAVWSHGGLSLALISACMPLGIGRGDVELYFSPMYHLTIVTGLLAVLYAGGSVRLLRRFDEDDVARVLRTEPVTRLFGTPGVIERILAAGGPSLGSRTALRNVVFGASRSGPDFPARLHAALPSVALMTGYGATEFGAVTRVYPDEVLRGDAGVGRPVAGVELSIRDDDGALLPTGAVGEVAVRSPMAVLGYLGDEAPRMVDGDRIRSGDLGALDDQGHLHLHGRSSELVKTGGENVFPAEVERVVVRHASVLDAVVYGVEDATWGERVECAVIPAPGSSFDTAALRAHCAAHLAGYKVPKRFRVVDEFPRTSTEKLDRQALRTAALCQEQPA
jgi:fatty-acyl-CoA synthase